MLDSENPELEELIDPEGDAQDTVAGGEDDGEEETIVVGFEGEEVQEEEPETPLIKKMRESLKEAKKAERAALARLAEKEAVVESSAPEKPTIASCNYDDAAFETALEVWYEGKAARDAKKAAIEAEAKAETDYSRTKWEGYVERKKALPDAQDAEDIVSARLTQAQQAGILRVAENPAEFIVALSKSPAKLDELAKIKAADMFGATVARMEGKVKVETRKAPPPESKLPAGSAGATVTGGNLEKLRVAAESSGDYTQYFAAKARLKPAS